MNITLDKKTFIIGVLSLSAVLLLVANLLAPRIASATYNTIEDPDYSLVTATAIQGGDAVYITEKRSGIMAVFVYDPNRRTLVLQDSAPIQNAFAKALGAGGAIRPRR